MIKPEQIPADAVNAAETEILSGIATDIPSVQIARLALASALEKWPNKEIQKWGDGEVFFILPHPTEVE